MQPPRASAYENLHLGQSVKDKRSWLELLLQLKGLSKRATVNDRYWADRPSGAALPIPFSWRYIARPWAWYSGSLVRFQFWKSSQLRPRCCSSHCQKESRLCMEALCHVLASSLTSRIFSLWHCHPLSVQILKLRGHLGFSFPHTSYSFKSCFHYPNLSQLSLFFISTIILLQAIVRSCFSCLNY